MKPRAELAQSAPSDMAQAMSKPETSLPEAPMRTWSRRPAPTRAVVSTTRVSAVACATVCERVARVKSSKRRRSTTVRPTRRAARIRRVTRSTTATTNASMSAAVRRDQPSVCCDPIDPRRRPTSTGRGSRLCDERVQLAARRLPEHRHQRELRAASRPRGPSRCPGRAACGR